MNLALWLGLCQAQLALKKGAEAVKSCKAVRDRAARVFEPPVPTLHSTESEHCCHPAAPRALMLVNTAHCVRLISVHKHSLLVTLWSSRTPAARSGNRMDETCTAARCRRGNYYALHADTHALSQVADLERDGETDGRVLKVRALMLDEQFDAAIADARALAEQHRGNHAVHEVRGLCCLCLLRRTHVCWLLWH